MPSVSTSDRNPGSLSPRRLTSYCQVSADFGPQVPQMDKIRCVNLAPMGLDLASYFANLAGDLALRIPLAPSRDLSAML